MATRRFVLSPSARRFLDAQDNQTKSRLVDILLWLCEHPYRDREDPSKSMFLAPPVMMRMYRDYFHWIIYYLDGDSEAGAEPDARLVVANIGRVGEQPRLTRPRLAPTPAAHHNAVMGTSYGQRESRQ